MEQVRLRYFASLAFVLAGTFVTASADSHGQWFEFCDDFTKPWCQQRDPWEERIETERHDFTQSAVTVGRGVVQLEGGYSYFYKDTGDEVESSHTFPEMLLRVGLSEDIEFRLRWNYAWQFIEDEPDRIGAEDLTFSLKFQMTRQSCCGCLPTSALEVRGTAPTGGDAFSADQVGYSFDYIYQWDLCEGVTLAGSTGFGTNGFADFGLAAEEPAEDHFNTWSQSAVVGFELTESNTMYAEWYGLFSDGREDEFVVSVFNVGIDHYLSQNLVVDVRAGVGLSDDADDFFTGVGGGYRF
jgi:Putative MetA-pathway of phenol degradation